MTRKFGQTNCAIWDSPEFCALTVAAQGTYFMLTTQPDIAPCGTLALTLRRWGKQTSDGTGNIASWLEELCAGGQLGADPFVLIDEDTEELFVRSFVKWDEGYKNPKRRTAIEASARAIRSPRLRAAAAVELAKFGMAIDSPPVHPSTPDRTPFDTQSMTNRSDKVPVPLSSHLPEPEPETGDGGLDPSNSHPAPNGAPRPRDTCGRHPNGTDKPCTPCKTARETAEQWDRDHDPSVLRRQHRADELATRRAAIAACTHCDETGLRLDPDTQLPAGRCDHRRPA